MSKSDRPIYVPKGRRELNERKELESSATKELNAPQNSILPKAVTKRPAETSLVYSERIPPTTELEDGEYKDIKISDDTLISCCLVLGGLPTELSEIAKMNIILQYLDKGATAKWISSGECLLVFKSGRLATSALSSKRNSIFKVSQLKDISSSKATELVEVARVTYESFVDVKPDRDSTVANRLIGAALGIRLPANTRQYNSATRTLGGSSNGLSASASKIPRARSPTRIDAWDD